MAGRRRGQPAQTLGTAQLPSDSDPEDEDYEDEEVDKRIAQAAKRGRSGSKSANTPMSTHRSSVADSLWAEMQAEDAAAASKRPRCVQLDPLLRDLQRKHPKPPKQLSQKYLFTEIAKYGCTLAAGAPGPPAVADVKQRARSTGTERLPASVETPGTPVQKMAVAEAGGMVSIEDTVKFAGQEVAVRRVVQKGSVEERNLSAELRKRKKTKLGGQLAALDTFLSGGEARDVNIVEKSTIDWADHKDKAGLEGLATDKRAGALERRDFLARAAERREGAAREASRAARSAAKAAAAGPAIHIRGP